MQPTRAQVVPSSPPSIIAALAPAPLAARYAARPAVPAPITATSTCMVFMPHLDAARAFFALRSVPLGEFAGDESHTHTRSQ